MSSKLSYLQKYYMDAEQSSSSSSSKKKKKRSKEKKSSSLSSRMQIIDEEDALFGSSSRVKTEELEEEMLETKEDRPQVAGIVDERPETEIIKERFVTNAFLPVVKVEHEDDEAHARVKEEPRDNMEDDSVSGRRARRHDSSSDSDHSPPRRKLAQDSKSAREFSGKSDIDVPRGRHDSDDSDKSPPRRRNADDSDNSPPRRRAAEVSNRSRPSRNTGNTKSSRRRHDSSEDSDKSPPRRKAGEVSESSRDKKRTIEGGSPVRRRKRHDSDDSDKSPPRRPAKIKRERRGSSSDLSPPRRTPSNVKLEIDSDGDISPPRAKTLDGKKAGLQKAANLKEELSQLKRREQDMFENMSPDVSGRGAETQVRGRLKAKEEERLRKEKEFGITDEVKEKYARWSKGMKQVEASREQYEEEQREMSKPLARDADDVDLDAHLKAIEREEDPMLNYLRNKRAKMAGNKDVPKYKGPMAAPNRYGIAPGYRWDGVDRSNGFEKRLFERRNNAKAVSEEAHMWSIADM